MGPVRVYLSVVYRAALAVLVLVLSTVIRVLPLVFSSFGDG
jgi:hypothetical protein